MKHVTGSAAEAAMQAVGDQVGQVFGELFGSRRTKPRASRSGDRLSADRIVEVAIGQMRDRGYDAVTMRSIAKELGTGPASLYAHVANRAELDQLVTGRICAQIRIPDPDPEHWDAQLRQSLVDMLALYREHPGVARCTMGMIPLQPGVLVVSERLIALLKAGGVPDQHCAWFIDVASLYVAGVAIEEDIWRERHLGQDPDEGGTLQHVEQEVVVEQVRNVFANLPAEHFPLLSALAVPMTSGDADDRFGFGVDLLVAGLKALAAQG
ncbi:MAG: TetR/AcrR family transcriptional regulator C-terminal domain-containing protein [Nocardioidaceae bacterium]|nr:TetR/AcrR family transcriptional regulator C-terminal domain-containing protein [Nocardioidaceae bacterium]